jgi:hypothetical protein
LPLLQRVGFHTVRLTRSNCAKPTIRIHRKTSVRARLQPCHKSAERNSSLRRRPGAPDARFAWRGRDPRAAQRSAKIPALSRAKLHKPNTTPTPRHAVPRAEHQRRIKTRHSFCEARGIGSAALKARTIWSARMKTYWTYIKKSSVRRKNVRLF